VQEPKPTQARQRREAVGQASRRLAVAQALTQRAQWETRRRVLRRRGEATPPKARRLPLRLKYGLVSWGTWGTQPAALFLNVVRGKTGISLPSFSLNDHVGPIVALFGEIVTK